jgi:hypothetical protein
VRTIHIERKDRGTVEDAVRTLRPALRLHRAGDANAPVTSVQASTWTGLPLDVAESALLALVSTGEVRLDLGDVDSDGALLFWPLRLAPARGRWQSVRAWWAPWSHRWRALRRGLGLARQWAEDTALFLLAPALMLVLDANAAGLLAPAMVPSAWSGIYAIVPGMLLAIPLGLAGVMALLQLVFLLLGIAGVVLLLGGVALLVGAVVIAVTEHRQIGTAIGVFLLGATTTALGVPWMKAALSGLRDMVSRESDASVTWAVWDTARRFLLGPRRRAPTPPHALHDPTPDGDGLRDEARLTALLARRAGRVHARDLVELFGWSLPDVERELTRVLLDYGGAIDVDDDGVLTFVFPHDGAGVGDVEPAAPLVERAAQHDLRPRLWDLSSTPLRFALGATSVALLGLLVLARMLPGEPVLLPTLEALRTTSFERPVLLTRGLGLWPYLFVAMVLAPRALLVGLRTHRWRQRERTRAVFRAILAAPTTDGAPGCWLEGSTLHTPLVRGLRGEVDVDAGTLADADGRRLYRVCFPDLAVSRRKPTVVPTPGKTPAGSSRGKARGRRRTRR